MSIPFTFQHTAAEDPIEKTSAPANIQSPGFHTFTLNASYQSNTSSSTFYDFPFNPSFYAMFDRYGGSLFLLIQNCSGPNELMTIWEGSARTKVVDKFFYRGQSLIALGAWHSWGYDPWGNLVQESWGWMENASMDWKAGIWQPTNGLTLQYQSNTILGQAKLSVLYTVPEPIPEFSLIGVTIVILIVVGLNSRRRKTS
jgi:hypothetical protein